MSRSWQILCLVFLVTVMSCRQNWYWVDGPRWSGRVDPVTKGTIYHSFTVIPYSLLDSANALLFGRDENAMIFYSVNRMLQDGFDYVDDPDSADFILTQSIRNDFGWHEDIEKDTIEPPILRVTVPFSLISSPFGSLDHQPLINFYNSQEERVFPKIHYVLYDAKTKKCLGQCTAGGIAKDFNILECSQRLFPNRYFQKLFNPVRAVLPT